MMKAVLDTLEGLPAELAEQYEPTKDGKYALIVEGVVPGFAKVADLQEANARLAEFRDNNRALNAAKAELEQKLAGFQGIDPVEHARLTARIKELESKGVKGSDDIAAVVSKAVAQAVGPLETKLKVMEASEQEAKAANARLKLEQELTAAGQKAGVNPLAMPDYIERGLKVFQIQDGRPVARKGDTPLFSKERPAEPLTMDEWAIELTETAPHIFMPSKGGGADSGKNGGGGGQQSRKTISSDPMEFGRNLEGIASGAVTVQQ